jgi:HlyD family type I secretion membrane fusion protein
MAADIWFAARKTELKGITRQSRQELDALIQKLDSHDKHNSRVRLHITGHADDHDDPYQNEQLAKLRAQTVGLYLLSNGWPPDSVTIKSPMKGVVKNVQVTTVGGVIQAGQPILEIVLTEDEMLVEAYVKPSEVAFLHVGQKAVVKLSSYDFNKYGGLDGELEHLSPDTLKDERQQRRPGGNPVDMEEGYYRILVRIKDTNLVRNGKRIEPTPGMTATVEIRTGQKTVLEYLFRPLQNVSQALRER